jgi:hypothetical protein
MHIRRFPNATNIASAVAVLTNAGDLTIVARDGVDRWLAMRCPDGCGELIKVNLDPRSGPAWRVYTDDQQLSLYPSISRDSGCNSHFVIWRNYIWSYGADSAYLRESSSELRSKLKRLSKRILEVLTAEPTDYYLLAERLSANPWDVQVACERLAKINRVRILETDDGTRVVETKGKGKKKMA